MFQADFETSYLRLLGVVVSKACHEYAGGVSIISSDSSDSSAIDDFIQERPG